MAGSQTHLNERAPTAVFSDLSVKAEPRTVLNSSGWAHSGHRAMVKGARSGQGTLLSIRLGGSLGISALWDGLSCENRGTI